VTSNPQYDNAIPLPAVFSCFSVTQLCHEYQYCQRSSHYFITFSINKLLTHCIPWTNHLLEVSLLNQQCHPLLWCILKLFTMTANHESQYLLRYVESAVCVTIKKLLTHCVQFINYFRVGLPLNQQCHPILRHFWSFMLLKANHESHYLLRYAESAVCAQIKKLLIHPLTITPLFQVVAPPNQQHYSLLRHF
jgi:hypothetical protein